MVDTPFTFANEPMSRSAAVLVDVPADLASKQALLSTLATGLNFPDYFGENWDALDECMRDLSWLPTGHVIVKHADVPLVNDVRSARIYLALLADAVRIMSKSDHPITIVFPTRCRAPISWLLRLRNECG